MACVRCVKNMKHSLLLTIPNRVELTCKTRLFLDCKIVSSHANLGGWIGRYLTSATCIKPQQKFHSSYDRTLCVTTNKSTTSRRKKSRYQPARDANYKEVYRFNHVTFVRLISSLKIYQTALTIVGSPIMFYMYMCDMVTKFECQVCVGIMTFAGAMLYLMSNFFRKIVCVVYVNEATQTVDISHLTFWGRRQDVRLDIADIKPLSDTAEKNTSTFVRLQTYTTGNTYYLFLNHGKIMDKDQLTNLIGW